MGYYIERALLKWVFRIALLVPCILIHNSEVVVATSIASLPPLPTITTTPKSLNEYELVESTPFPPLNDTESSSTTKLTPILVEFSCPLNCECHHQSESHLDISCSARGSPDSNSTEQQHKLMNVSGIDHLSIRGGSLLDAHSISQMIPPFSENTLRELELHQVQLDPVSFFNAPIFRHSQSSLKKLSIHEAMVPDGSAAEDLGSTVRPFTDLKDLDSLNICDSSPELSKLVLRSLPLVNHIKIVNNSITEITPDSFAHLVQLQSCNMSHNRIQLIPTSLSSLVSSLKTLDVSHNQIEHLQEQVFVGLNLLVHLDVSHNKIQYIDTEVFTPLTSVDTIDLSNNDVIQFFEPYFERNEKLRVLRMANAWVQHTFIHKETALRSRLEIERLINTLQTVETLDISDNDMTIIPETLTHAPKLAIVHLHGNQWQCTCQDRWLPKWMSTTGVSFGTRNSTDNIWCYNKTAKFNDDNEISRFPLAEYLKKLPVSCTNPNVIARTPFKYYAILGKDTILQCHTQREPLPTVTWITPSKTYISYDDPAIDGDSQNVTGSLATMYPDGRLHISNVTGADYGLYLCIASYSDLNITHYVHLGIDVSIFADVRIMSIIIGWITSFTFLFTVLTTQLVRSLLNRCGINCVTVSTVNQTRRVRTFFESMEQHKHYQLDWLRDNYNMQAKKIKDNCFLQLERIRESYQTQTKNLCDIREYGTQQLNTVRDQYHDQIRKVSSYSAQQLCRVRENYLFQRNRVCKFSSHQLLRLRETYKWQAQTLNKILENLPRTLNFDTCRGMGACGRTDSIYLNNVSDITSMEDSLPGGKEDSGTYSVEKMEHISLLIPPEFVSQYIVKNSETPIAMEECFLTKIKAEDYKDKPCCSHSLRNPYEENHEI